MTPDLSRTEAKGIAREAAREAVEEITGKIPVVIRASRPTMAATAIEVGRSLVQNLGRIIVGLLMMAGGGYIGYIALETEPHNATMLYVGIGVGILGALIIPSIWDMAVKPVFVFIFPNGVNIPIIGGRRKDDPPAPAPDVKPGQ